MHSFGIFTSRLSLERVMDIDSELTRYGMVTYLPYTSPDHLKFLYEQNRDRFDAFSMFQTGTITR